jgi:hypothetical protein
MKRLLPVFMLTLLVPACATNDSSPTQPRPDLPSPVQAPTTATVPPQPIPTPVPDTPPTQVIRFNPPSARGSAPFLLQVNMCLSGSSLPGYPLDFRYDYGDGTIKGGRGVCRTQHTYQRSGNFKGVFCVTDREPGHGVCTHQTIPVS